MIQVKKITYTPADIIAMFATPQIVLAAPASGYVNNILGITHDMVFNSVAYGTARDTVYGQIPGTTNRVFLEPNLRSVANINQPCVKSDAARVLFSTTKDFYVTTDAQADSGNSTITAYIVYETKVLS